MVTSAVGRGQGGFGHGPFSLTFLTQCRRPREPLLTSKQMGSDSLAGGHVVHCWQSRPFRQITAVFLPAIRM